MTAKEQNGLQRSMSRASSSSSVSMRRFTMASFTRGQRCSAG
jgi:hypothetical protein